MKTRHLPLHTLVIGAFAACLAPLSAGPTLTPSAPMPGDILEEARRPITNPTLFDLPITRTQVRPIYVFHRLPDKINTVLGDIPVGGDVSVYALQFEYAFNDEFSLIATKDGYIDINADNTLSNESGWANLAAGLKWNFHRRDNWATAASLVFEAPTGNRSVFQGEGDGTLIPSISSLWMPGKAQLNGTLGARLPFDNDTESTFLFASARIDYEVFENFFPMLELNWFHVLDQGDGGRRFNNQVDGFVPAVTRFEGGDIFNLGAANATDNRNFVSLGAGFRYRLLENLDLGFAYEMPLTNESDSLMKDRFTVDMVWRF